MNINWSEMLVPDANTVEVIVRGSIVYLGIVTFMRFVVKREVGGLGTADVLVLVLIADAAQNAMSINYKSVPTGLALVATIILWDVGLDWLAYRSRWLEKFVHSPALPLVVDGERQRRNLRREFITDGELMSALREQGIDNLADVKSARLEGDGRISVIPRERPPG